MPRQNFGPFPYDGQGRKAEIYVSIDFESLTHQLDNRAVLSRRKIATQLGGAIIVEAFKVDHKELPKKTD